METHVLVCHPDTLPIAVQRIEARLIPGNDDWLRLRFRIDGCSQLVLPAFAGRGRADGLWQTTCFELFVQQPDAAAYTEFNLSPSERWAAYDFAGYRDGMCNRKLPREPVCTPRVGQQLAIFDAAIPSSALPKTPWRYGLSAVIEETGGTKSYWALMHSAGAPDFHHPACFAATLPAPEQP